jgi:hypothetical protein
MMDPNNRGDGRVGEGGGKVTSVMAMKAEPLTVFPFRVAFRKSVSVPETAPAANSTTCPSDEFNVPRGLLRLQT